MTKAARFGCICAQIHLMASRRVAPTASSMRNLLEALAVLLFKVHHRDMPVRLDISLSGRVTKIGQLYEDFLV